MKLTRLDKLMATLATQISASQLDQMLSMSTDFQEWDRTEITSPILLLVKLNMRSDGETAFLESLTHLLEGVKDAQRFVDAVCEHQLNASNEGEVASGQFPNDAFLHMPKRAQKMAFKVYLRKISDHLNRQDFEIIKALSPIPLGRKDSLDVGYKLFYALQHHGKIGENDVEYLDDFFTHLNLIKPLETLRAYQREYPAQHCPATPSAPMLRLTSDPGHTPNRPRLTHQGCSSYPPFSQHSPLTGTGMESHTLPSHHIITQAEDGNSQLYSRPPGHRDPSYPRLGNPPVTTPPQSTSNTPSPSPYLLARGSASQGGGDNCAPITHPPPTNVSNVRGAGEYISLSNPVQMESSIPSSRPPPMNPMFHPVHHFQKQSSLGTQSVLSPSATQSSQLQSVLPPSTSLPSQPPVTFSHNSSHSTQSQPVHPTANYAPSHPSLPSLDTVSPAGSAPSSVSHELASESTATFPDAQTCQSLRGHPSNFSSLPPGHSLPTAFAGEDKLLGRVSRPMEDLARCEPPGHPRPGDAPQYRPVRSVLTREDFRTSVGRAGGEDLSSINVSVSREAENMENNRSRAPSAPASNPRAPSVSASNPSASGDSHHYLSAAPLPEDPHRPPTHPPTPAYPSQRSSFVSGVSSFSTRAASSGSSGSYSGGSSGTSGSGGSYSGSSIGASGSGGSYRELSNPHNTLSSQIVSHNANSNSTLISSPLYPHSSQRTSVPSHEPSTGSLVNRQHLHGPSDERPCSSSFAPIPEEDSQEGENGCHGESDDSHVSEHSSVAPVRKRLRREEAVEHSTSSSSGTGEGEDEEGQSDVKRVRTEEQHNSKGTGFFSKTLQSLPFIGRWYTQKRDSDSDSDAFEDARENNSPT